MKNKKLRGIKRCLHKIYLKIDRHIDNRLRKNVTRVNKVIEEMNKRNGWSN